MPTDEDVIGHLLGNLLKVLPALARSQCLIIINRTKGPAQEGMVEEAPCVQARVFFLKLLHVAPVIFGKRIPCVPVTQPQRRIPYR